MSLLPLLLLLLSLLLELLPLELLLLLLLLELLLLELLLGLLLLLLGLLLLRLLLSSLLRLLLRLLSSLRSLSDSRRPCACAAVDGDRDDRHSDSANDATSAAVSLPGLFVLIACLRARRGTGLVPRPRGEFLSG